MNKPHLIMIGDEIVGWKIVSSLTVHRYIYYFCWRRYSYI